MSGERLANLNKRKDDLDASNEKAQEDLAKLVADPATSEDGFDEAVSIALAKGVETSTIRRALDRKYEIIQDWFLKVRNRIVNESLEDALSSNHSLERLTAAPGQAQHVLTTSERFWAFLRVCSSESFCRTS